MQLTFFYLGVAVLFGAGCAIVVRFSTDHKRREAELYDQAVASRAATAAAAVTAAQPRTSEALAG